MDPSADPDDDFLSQRLKQADMDDPADGDVDALIGSALRRGRRRVLVRRASGVVAVCAVLAAAAGFGITQLRGRSIEVGPATTASPSATSGPATTSPTTSPSATPSDSPSDSTSSTGRITKKEMQATLEQLLGSSFTVADVQGDDTNTGDTYATLLRFSVTDDAGTAWILAGLIPEEANYSCQPPRCEITARDGGSLWLSPDARDPDKTGRDSFVRFTRPDGRVVEIMQQNFDGGNDPVTRATLPLTDKEAIAFVTDPVWDGLAARCQPHGSYC